MAEFVTPKGCDISVKKAIQQIGRKLGSRGYTTHAGLTLTDLTAIRLVATDTNKALVSSDIVNWITGTNNQLTVTDDGDGTITLSTPQDLATDSSPQFTGIELGHATDTTITRESAGNLNIEGNLVYRAGGTDVPIGDGGTGQSTAQAAIDALSAVSGATNEHVLTKDTATGNAKWKIADGISNLDGGASATVYSGVTGTPIDGGSA